MLHEIYSSLQEEMITKLSVSRSTIPHSAEKGAATESNWIEWFKEYLPKRYQVDKAFVVDSEGSISEQIDIVIYDAQYSHLIFRHQGVRYIPAESVYAVFEVKQELNKVNLGYAGDKAESVRQLKRTSAKITHAGGTFEPKVPHFIPAGILTLTSSWSEPLGNKLWESLLSLKKDRIIHFGCVVKEGSFKLNNEGFLETSKNEYSLVTFFFELLLKLQSIGTVTAIDISSYAKILR